MFAYRQIALTLILLGLIFCVTSSVRAQDSGLLILEDAHTAYPLGLHLEYLEDPGGKLTIEEVTAPEFAAGFALNREETANFGITKSVYWIRLYVRNEASDVSDWMLAFSNNRVGLVDLYVPSAGDSNWVHQQAGTYLPATVRKYAYPHIVFPLSFPTSSETTIYLRLQSNLPVRVSLSLWPAALFEQYNHGFFGFIGVFYGGAVIIVFYNLVLLLSTRKINYLYLSMFTVFYVLNTAASDGTAQLYLYPNLPIKNAIFGFATLAVVFAVIFVRSFLELKQRLPWLNWLLGTLAVIEVLAFTLYAAYPPGLNLSAFTITLNILLIAILTIVGSIVVWRQGLVSARYFMLGWLAILLNAIFLNSTNLAFIKGYQLFDIGQYIGTFALVIFLSLAMSDQLNELNQKSERIERALRTSEGRFRHLYERAPLGIAIGNPNGLIEQVNPTYQEMFGYDENELYRLNPLDLIHPEDRQESQQLFQRIVRAELPYFQRDCRYIRKDGSIVWVRRSISSLHAANGNISGTFTILMDITQQKRVEENLRRYQESLEELINIRTRELERSREQLAILNRASQVVNAAGLEVEKLYVAIRAASAWLVPAEVFAITLVDRSTREFEDVFLVDGDRRLSGGRYPLENSVVEKIVASGMSVKIEDFRSHPDEDWGLRWMDRCPGLRSGMSVLLRGDKEFLGLLSVQSYQPNAYQESDLSAFESLAAHASIAVENARLHRQAQKAVLVEERQRLARELHDSVTQNLYSIALLGGGWGLKASQGRLADPQSSFAQIEDLSLQALKEMRLLIFQLRPPLLDELGLLDALQHRLETVEQRVNIDARLKVEGDLPVLPRLVEEQVYYIVQEALNNALRHAHATSIQISMQSLENQFHIAVIDNGRGFNPDNGSKGMGLQTMRERAEAIGAEIHIYSSPGQGTKVELTVGI